ncbi:MAG: RND transporter [Proteobacteria bacterium]|nr:MAG: RND transporter [Pseudomonadota bacterium]
MTSRIAKENHLPVTVPAPCPVTPQARLRRFLRWGAVAGAAFVLSGCILTSDLPNPALDVPPAYQAPKDARAPAPKLDWWRGFRSRELTALMEEARAANLDMAAAAARIRQADAQARVTGAALLPSLSGGLDASRSQSSASGGSGTVGGARVRDSLSASLAASYQLDFWGQNRDALLAAEETAGASRFDHDVVALTAFAAVATAYFQVLATQDRIRIASNNIANAQRVLDAIRQRLQAGTGSDLDVAQQESVLANQKAAVPVLRQTLAQNRHALATLIGRPPESTPVRGGSLSGVSAPRVSPGLPSELLLQRPDIRRQEFLLAAATANIGSARAQFFPNITLTGQGGYQSVALAALFTPHAAFYTLAAGLTQPIFDGGRILANFELTQARQDELLQTYRLTVVSAFADVNTALVAVRESAERLRLQREVVAASRRAFALAEQQLRAGTVDIVTVLNTQLTLFQAEDALAQAQLARLLAIVSLYQALGGGWEPIMERPVDAL